MDVFREELIAAVSEIVDQENSSSKQRFADGFTVAMKQGVKAMTRAGREVLADIQKATADCPPDKAAVAAFRGVTQSGCYAGSISVSDRAPGRRRGAQVIHYDLAEEMRMAFSTALMSPSWKMRYHRRELLHWCREALASSLKVYLHWPCAIKDMQPSPAGVYCCSDKLVTTLI